MAITKNDFFAQAVTAKKVYTSNETVRTIEELRTMMRYETKIMQYEGEDKLVCRIRFGVTPIQINEDGDTMLIVPADYDPSKALDSMKKEVLKGTFDSAIQDVYNKIKNSRKKKDA
ncbi:hypothetical protein [Endozoicomonas sp. SCSIO W0465]|uniref:hypothetical protein n=1 Tax=Endozoicomonas sp. SCSIO W0465 TaxID=2918516 RepID=UPI002075947E|nr:hypothetical protein [Endozoicomonas sp. SCSIO W0465]USE39537.1 hypothetical protein MJO57_16045 [Endozoicomonas sp. SCSIO W0465]